MNGSRVCKSIWMGLCYGSHNIRQGQEEWPSQNRKPPLPPTTTTTSCSNSKCARRAPGVALLKIIWFSGRKIRRPLLLEACLPLLLLRLGPCCRSRICICTGRSRACICTSSTCSGRSRSRSLQCGKCLAIIAKPAFLVCGPLCKYRFKHGAVKLLSR